MKGLPRPDVSGNSCREGEEFVLFGLIGMLFVATLLASRVATVYFAARYGHLTPDEVGEVHAASLWQESDRRWSGLALPADPAASLC